MSQENREAPGAAAVYLFPFVISTVQGLRTNERIEIGDYTLRLYSPFVHGEGDEPSLTQVNWEYVPFTRWSRQPDEPMKWVRSSGLKRDWESDSTDADALRIDFYPQETLNDNTAFDVGEQLVGLLRHRTQQWWIGRDVRFARPWLRNTTPVDSAGGLSRGKRSVAGYAMNIGTSGYERLLTEGRFVAMAKDLEEGNTIPLYSDLLLDSHYYHAIRNTRRSVLAASMGCEAAINARVAEEADSRGLEFQTLRRQLDSSDLLANMTDRCERVFGHSFAEERPDDFRILEHMWEVRGSLAHGKELSIASNDISDGSEEGARIEIVKSARVFSQWILTI